MVTDIIMSEPTGKEKRAFMFLNLHPALMLQSALTTHFLSGRNGAGAVETTLLQFPLPLLGPALDSPTELGTCALDA